MTTGSSVRLEVWFWMAGGLMVTGSSVKLEKDETGDKVDKGVSGSGGVEGEIGPFLVLVTVLVFTTVVFALFSLTGAVLVVVVIVSKKKKWKQPTVATLERQKG